MLTFDDFRPDPETAAEVAEMLRMWRLRIPEYQLKEHQARRFSDVGRQAPFRKNGMQAFCLWCNENLMLCGCEGLGGADKIPFIHDLKPQPAGMLHADHYFRLVTILERMYWGTFGCVDVSGFLDDWGGLMTAALKMNTEALLQAAEAYSSGINLATLDKEALSDLAKPLKILDILDVDTESQTAVGNFIKEAVAKFVVGNLSQMCRFELWLSMKVVQASPIPDAHKELLVEVLGNINTIVWVRMSHWPIIAPDYSKQPQICGFADDAMLSWSPTHSSH